MKRFSETDASDEARRLIRAKIAFAGLILLTLTVGLRLLALDSDPYPRLDWSSGLLTDEGFYLHNARNLVLFGHSRTDDFNNALLSPTLNAIQILVFRRFGVGLTQARSLSLAAGLLTLPLFFSALRRACGSRAALLATVFLGLDHLPLLYGRMALMDTPAALVLTAAFYCWVRAQPPHRPELEKASKIATRVWLFGCGAALGLAFATRGLCAFAIPAPLLILCRVKRGDRLAFYRLLAFIFGLAVVLALFLLLWTLPHRTELARTNAFYLRQQLLPHDFGRFIRIITRSFFGDTRGIAPALLRHTPVLSALALAGLWWRVAARRAGKPLSENSLYLGGWLLSGLLVFAVVGYSPSRYFILFFPALAAVAALTALRSAEVAPFIYIPNRTRAIFGSFFAYHLFLFVCPLGGLPGTVFVAALTLCAALLLWFGGNRQQEAGNRKIRPFADGLRKLIRNRALSRSLILLWALVNGLWIGDWLGHLAYGRRDTERWLTAHMPPDAVLIGDAAPGLSVNTGFVSVPVIPGLCNDDRPLERFAGKPRAIIILDGNRRETWWDRRYPALVAPERRILSLPDAVGFPVGVYLVPPDYAKNNKLPKNHL